MIDRVVVFLLVIITALAIITGHTTDTAIYLVGYVVCTILVDIKEHLIKQTNINNKDNNNDGENN